MDRRILPRRAETHCGICGRAFTATDPYASSVRGVKYHSVCANGATHYAADLADINHEHPRPFWAERLGYWSAIDPRHQKPYSTMVQAAGPEPDYQKIIAGAVGNTVDLKA